LHVCVLTINIVVALTFLAHYLTVSQQETRHFS
jgi:hypothetical protein